MTNTMRNYKHITVDLTARADDTFDGCQEIECIDTEASHLKLQTLIIKSLQKEFPGVNVVLSQRGSVRGNFVYGESKQREEEEVLDFLELIIPDAFSRSDEWLVKN